jgi:hypothetical protein
MTIRNQAMLTFQSSQLNRVLLAVCVISAALMAGSAIAQQPTATTKTVKAETPKQTIKTVSVRAPTLSKELQKSLEAGNTRKATKQCGSECQGNPSSTLSTGTTGGARDHTCNGGNCACAGASDCVLMAPICQEGTIGCNDYGCTCKEGDSGDG